MAHLSIIAKITPKPEHFIAAKTAIQNIVAETNEEAGCRTFRLLEDPKTQCLHLYEEWDDSAALDAHYSKPYTREVFAAYENWLAVPVEIVKLNRIA